MLLFALQVILFHLKIYYFPASGNFCRLLMTAHCSFDPDQARQNSRSDLVGKIFLKSYTCNFNKKNISAQKSLHKVTQHALNTKKAVLGIWEEHYQPAHLQV